MAACRKKHEQKNRKTKVFLEFDETARTNYLKGFQKRKTERQQAAREKKDKGIREERKALRQKIHDLKRTPAAVQETRVPEIEQLVEPEVFDLPDHTVTIADISQVDFVGKTGVRLGQNTGQDDSDDDEKEEGDRDSDSKSDDGIEKREKQTVVDSKDLLKKLASCTNQLSATKIKNKKNSQKQKVRARLQAKKVKRKKNKMHKPRKR